MYDLIIIGGGPAGLTAAIYAIRKRLNCVLITPELGGKANAHMTIEGIETHYVINGSDLVERFRNEIEYLGFSRMLTRVVRLSQDDGGFTVSLATGEIVRSRAVILATGAEPVRLDVPGADRFFLRGVAYSTISYAPLFLDKTVALVGSDGMALRGAAELAQIVKKLYLIAPEHGELDSPLGRMLRASDRVELFEDWQPAAVEGDRAAERLIIRSPDGEPRTLEIAAVFVELGLRPNSALVRDWVEIDQADRIVVNCAAATSTPGLFAAGDVTQMPAEQVLIAIGEGAKAALNAYEYLLGSMNR